MVEGIIMSATKLLGLKGKEKFFSGFKKYIEAKIDFHTLPIRPSLNQEEVEKRLCKAEEEFKAMFMALEWRVE